MNGEVGEEEEEEIAAQVIRGNLICDLALLEAR